MCRLSKNQNQKLCHAAGYVSYLLDDAQRVKEGVELGEVPVLWIILCFHHLSSLLSALLLSSSYPGDGEAAGR